MKVDEARSQPVWSADHTHRELESRIALGNEQDPTGATWNAWRARLCQTVEPCNKCSNIVSRSKCSNTTCGGRAVALGWPADRVLVIDEDQGRSGQTVEGRLGFQRLLAEVGLDHAVGLVLGIEMRSRLARSCKDWHQLLELCAIFRTLLADQDGLYDPRDYNDRLLLGLKGTMSEAELHILKGRMLAGKRNKARRGELFNHAPIGFVRVLGVGMALDLRRAAQDVVRLIFDKFDELGTVSVLVCVTWSSTNSSCRSGRTLVPTEVSSSGAVPTG